MEFCGGLQARRKTACEAAADREEALRRRAEAQVC